MTESMCVPSAVQGPGVSKQKTAALLCGARQGGGRLWLPAVRANFSEPHKGTQLIESLCAHVQRFLQEHGEVQLSAIGLGEA